MSSQTEHLNAKNIAPSRRGEAGFSLVQVALGIIVLSIIAVPLMKLYQAQQAKHKATLNIEKMNRITYALNKFAQQNTRLPVPADPTLPATSTNYGTEVDVPSSMACGSTWSSKNIRCASPSGGEVLMGAIPFNAIGLNEEDTIDMQGMKMTYAVTRTMTNRTTYNNAGGRIRILNQNSSTETLNGGTDNPTIDASGTPNVLYVVVSHGGDRRGAYDKSGARTACATVGMDRQNCSDTGIFRGMQEMNAGAMVPGLSRSVSLGSGADYFDDTIRYRNSVLDGMWAQQDNLNAAGNNNIYLSGRMQVLVGGNRFRSGPSDDPKHMLDVVGNARASNRVISQSLCDSAGAANTNCFRIKNISASASETVTQDKPVYCGTTGPTTGTTGRPLTQIVANGTTNGYASQNCGQPRNLHSTLPATACPYGIRSWSGGTYTCNPS